MVGIKLRMTDEQRAVFEAGIDALAKAHGEHVMTQAPEEWQKLFAEVPVYASNLRWIAERSFRRGYLRGAGDFSRYIEEQLQRQGMPVIEAGMPCPNCGQVHD